MRRKRRQVNCSFSPGTVAAGATRYAVYFGDSRASASTVTGVSMKTLASVAHGLADNLLARPLTSSRWLLGHAALTVLGAALLMVLTGLAMWGGALASGSD